MRGLLSLIYTLLLISLSTGVCVGQEQRVVRFIFGHLDDKPAQWEGTVTVQGGTLEEVIPLNFTSKDKFDASRFSCRTEWLKSTIAFARTARPVGDPQMRGLMVKISGGDQARVILRTNQGEYAASVSALSLEKPVKLGGRVEADLAPQYWRFETPETASRKRADDFPVIKPLADDNVWMAWTGWTAEQGDEIFISHFDGGQWSEQATLSDDFGDYYRPTIGVGPRGELWVIWGALVDGNFDLYGKFRLDGKWSGLQRLTQADESDINQQLATDSRGRMFMTWQSFRNGRPDIYLKYLNTEGWSAALQVTTSTASEWLPDIAVGADDHIYIAYDTYRHGDYDVYMRSWKKGVLEPEVAIAATERYEANVSIAADSRGRVWLAWDDGATDWGKEFPDWNGLLSGAWKSDFVDKINPLNADGTPTARYADNPTSPARIAADGTPQRWSGLQQVDGIQVACYDQGKLSRPAAELSEQFDPVIAFSRPIKPWRDPKMPPMCSYFYADMVIDGADRPWVFFRNHREMVTDRNDWFTYEVYAAVYDGSHWSRPVELPWSDGRSNVWTSAAASDGSIWAAWHTDERGHHTNKPGNTSYHKRRNIVQAGVLPLTLDGVKAPELTNTVELAGTAGRVISPGDAPRRNFKMNVHGREYTAYWGDLHRHTDISWDGRTDGSVLDLFRYTLDAGGMDFVAVTDHYFGDRGGPISGRTLEYGPQIYPWWRTQKMTDMFTVSGMLQPLHGYERSLTYPHGHRNIINAKRGMTYLPSLQQSNLGPKDELYLWEAIRKEGSLSIPHTSATRMGCDWTYAPPAWEPVVELYQGCRSSYEYPGAPKSPPNWSTDGGDGPQYAGGYVQTALQKGYKYGFIASSDHASTHISYAVVLAEEFTREGLMQAITERRTYAANAHILCDFQMDGHAMGEEYKATEAPEIKVRVQGTTNIKTVELVRNNEFIYTLRPDGREAHFTFIDKQIPNGQNYYYVRVIQEDEQMAWVSPIWVEYRK